MSYLLWFVAEHVNWFDHENLLRFHRCWFYLFLRKILTGVAKKMRESVQLLLRRRELTTNPDQWRKIKRASSRAAQTAIRRLADAGRSELGL